jgi:hemin uptake protein HemP
MQMRTVIVTVMNFDNAGATPADGAMSDAVSSRTQNAAAALVSRVSSGALLGACRELVILHQGREYTLRVTRSGKLILTA